MFLQNTPKSLKPTAERSLAMYSHKKSGCGCGYCGSTRWRLSHASGTGSDKLPGSKIQVPHRQGGPEYIYPISNQSCRSITYNPLPILQEGSHFPIMTLYFTCPSTNLLVDNLVSGSDALVLAGKFNPPISESPRPGSGLTPPRPHTPPSLALACPPPPSDTKATPPRLRPIPDPISPSTPSKGGTVQCSGTTKKGRRCMRRVKVACSVLANTHPGVEIERYCYHHA